MLEIAMDVIAEVKPGTRKVTVTLPNRIAAIDFIKDNRKLILSNLKADWILSDQDNGFIVKDSNGIEMRMYLAE
jgi:hypothetical protein